MVLEQLIGSPCGYQSRSLHIRSGLGSSSHQILTHQPLHHASHGFVTRRIQPERDLEYFLQVVVRRRVAIPRRLRIRGQQPWEMLSQAS